MIRFFVTAIVAFLLYLLFTTSSGNLFLWSKEELIIGAIFALIVAAIVKNRFASTSLRMLNPKRWFLFLAYLGPFLWAMAKANVDVVYRVITGRINPGIVRISPGLRNDLSLTMLANSITLTPGTLTVEVDEETNDLYVHWIRVKKETLEKMPRDYKDVCGEFPDWARRVAG
ncbi:MAG: cation:proton antiporter [Dehalococcoidia bacterium]|nr:MAG: cation:proton antiporter [Dehalococcoidia bacterium]